MYGSHGSIGSQYLSGDGVIGTSGKPVRIYSATWLSDATARDLVIRAGAADTATIWVQHTGDTSNTVTVNWEGGLLFPTGAFFDIGSAVSAVFAISKEV